MGDFLFVTLCRTLIAVIWGYLALTAHRLCFCVCL